MLAVASIAALALVGTVAPRAQADTAVGGQLLGFGDNRYGQLGFRSYSTQVHPTPAAVPLPAGSGSVITLAQGNDFTIAVTTSGAAYAFGHNYYGQLGIGNVNIGTDSPVAPTAVTLPGATGPVASVAAGAAASFFITTTGQLYSAGDNSTGALGRTASGNDPTPGLVSLPNGGTAVKVAAGWSHTLVLSSDGNVYAFGSDTDGEQGPLGVKDGSTPVKVTGLPASTRSTRVLAISAGNNDSFVLLATGNLYSFGDNENDQLGRATTNTSDSTPAIVSFGSGISVNSISAGYSSALAMASGKVYAWGEDNDGQLGTAGDSSLDPVATPTVVTPVVGAGPVVSATSTMDSSFLTTSRGQLISFGDDVFGQLGRAPNANNYDPTPTLVTLPAGTTLDAAPVSSGSSMVIQVSDLVIGPGAFPDATVGATYLATPPSTGGLAPLTVSKVSALPAGLYLGGNGQILGTPTGTPGTTAISYTITDADGVTVSGAESLTVDAAPAPVVPTPAPTPGPVAPPAAPGPAAPAPSITLPIQAGPSSSALKAALLAHLVPSGRGAHIAVLLKKGWSQSLTVLEPGKTVITWTYQPPKVHGAKHAPKPVVVASATVSFSKTGSSHLTVKLSRAGATLLKHARSLKLTLTGAFAPKGGKAVTVSRGTTLRP